MKKYVLLVVILTFTTLSFAQADKFWSPTSEKSGMLKDKGVARLSFPKSYLLFQLDIAPLRAELFTVVNNQSKHATIISLPNADGGIEQFELYEASNFEPDLQARYPQIRAFSGKGITDKYATLKLSLSPQGIQTMVFRTDKANEFIEPFSQDHTIYAVFKSQRQKGALPWTCSTDEPSMVTDVTSKAPAVTTLSSAGQLKTMRLAQSCNGEYANFFGASTAGTPADIALVLAAFNATLTRCNGVYEKDLALHLNLVASSTNVIYCNPATDPYSTTLSQWNTQLQQALNTTLTGVGTTLAANNAAYDIGHMFGASGGGGNAGCIGCVCVNGVAAGTGSTKGRGITSPADGIPQGDNFDIDYVVHEIGHQLGGNHTYSHISEGTGVNKEVGSGVTIMGYAGITPQDVAPHSIDIYHEATIAQIQSNLATKTCPVTTSLSGTNATPVVNTVPNYTIPITTPFVLTGSATDSNPGDVLTYCWEQNDDAGTSTGAASNASTTKTIGPNFISWPATASPSRYFPKLSSVIANSATTSQVGGDAGMLSEALSSVARTLNFRLTVRDNCPYSSTAPIKVGQTQFTDMVVTVTAAAGPFVVSAPNTAVSWTAGSTQTVTWNVAGTTANGVNCANVDILLSTDGGLTYPITLLSATANDGTQSITVPANIGTTNRIMVKGASHIFFDISNTNFSIVADTTAPTAPTLTASGTTINSTNLSWSGATDNVGVTAYDVYRAGVLIGSTTTATTFNVTGLLPSTSYSFTVKAKDAAGNVSVNSNTVNVTTLADTTPPTAPTLTASGTTINSTNLSWSGATDNVGVTGYEVYQGGILIGTTTTATTFNVTGLLPSTSYSFTVKAKDAAGNVSVNSNTVNVTTLADTTPPTAPTLTASGTTINSTNLSWSGATDNVGVTGYEVYQAGLLIGTTTTATTFNVTGLLPSTSYSFTVKAKDAAGNVSVNSNTVNVTTLADTTPPTAPTLTASGTTINSTILSWSGASDNVGVTGYEVYQAGLLIGTTTTATTFNVTGLLPSTSYSFTVKAKDAAGNVSVNSNTVNVTTLADTTPPTAPTLTASGTTINSTNLSWSGATDNVGVTGYEVYQAGLLIGTTTTATTFNMTGLLPSTSYSFTVKAKDAAGNVSVNSNTVNVTTLGTTTVLTVKMYLEGFYDTDTHAMRSVKVNQGTGAITTDVDTVIFELRNPANMALAATSSGTLQTNGLVTVTFPVALSGSYYLTIRHRNSIQTWSASPLTISAATPVYDFTDQATKAFGSNMILVEPNVWAFYSGDIDQDGLIDASDYSLWETDANNFAFGSFATDLNGDGNVDPADYSLWESNANSFIFALQP